MILDDITITGPIDVPDRWDPDNGLMIDMSWAFALHAKARHGDHLHVYTMEARKDLYEGWPELLNHAVRMIRDQVRRAVEDCQEGTP